MSAQRNPSHIQYRDEIIAASLPIARTAVAHRVDLTAWQSGAAAK
jgi:hypothetical protein